MKILILNGPNLNLLGKREPEVYGSTLFEDFFPTLQKQFPSAELSYFQSNIEGELINAIQQAGLEGTSIVFNPGGYTHTSVALADAIKAVNARVIEVHISNIFAREPERRMSLVSGACIGCITGLGLVGYQLAIEYLLKLDKNK